MELEAQQIIEALENRIREIKAGHAIAEATRRAQEVAARPQLNEINASSTPEQMDRYAAEIVRVLNERE